MKARIWHGTVFVLVIAALAVQLAVATQVASVPAETTTGFLRGTDLVGRLIRVLSFFTIQSNILCGIVAGLLALDPDRDGRAFRAVRSAALIGITVTGIVYSSILAATHEPKGFNEIFVNTVVHYVIPVMMVLGWILFGPRPRLDTRSVGWSMLWPAAWIVYTLIRGALWHWYPYPFVDVKEHGYLQVAINGVGVLAVLAAVAFGFAWIDRRLPAIKENA